MTKIYESEKYRAVPQDLKDNHRFCAGCGAEMRLSRTVTPNVSYNRRTGEETKDADIVKLAWVCQNGGEGCDRVEL